MIVIKSSEDLKRIREAGIVLARTLRGAGALIVPGKTTTGELDQFIYDRITEAGGKPSFLGYGGPPPFPASACISVNEEVVHGIPGSRILQEGDIVGIDIGVYLNGFHADSAYTFPVGEVSAEVKRLLAVTKECLNQAIAKARIGNWTGDIGVAVQKYAERNGYGVVRDLTGHGIGQNLHEEPSVPNFGRPRTGARLREGMTLAIEPMINMGTHKVKTLSDRWTMVTADGKPSAHFEHTVAITGNGPVALTLHPDDE